MNSKTFIKVLRKVIREEVRSAVKEIITEQTVIKNHESQLHEVASDFMPNKPMAKSNVKKQYTKNSVLNDLLNETAAQPISQELVDWSSTNFKSDMASAYGDMGSSPTAPLATKGINGEPVNMNNEAVATTVNAMTKDYSALMKAIDKKKGK